MVVQGRTKKVERRREKESGIVYAESGEERREKKASGKEGYRNTIIIFSRIVYAGSSIVLLCIL